MQDKPKKTKCKYSTMLSEIVSKDSTSIIAVLLARQIFPDEYLPVSVIISLILFGRILNMMFKLLRVKTPPLREKEQLVKDILVIALIMFILATELFFAIRLMNHFLYIL